MLAPSVLMIVSGGVSLIPFLGWVGGILAIIGGSLFLATFEEIQIRRIKGILAWKEQKSFIGLGIVLLSVSLLVACGVQNSKTTSTSNDEKTVATSNTSKETITLDTPVVTDDAIESIRTYADYIDLYKKIFDDYFTKAEESFKGTAMEIMSRLPN